MTHLKSKAARVKFVKQHLKHCSKAAVNKVYRAVEKAHKKKDW